MISLMDTGKVEDIARELSMAAGELEMEFDALFKRLANVTTVTGEWVGNQADSYFLNVAQDRQQYTVFVDELRSLARELNAEAGKVQDYIMINNRRNG